MQAGEEKHDAENERSKKTPFAITLQMDKFINSPREIQRNLQSSENMIVKEKAPLQGEENWKNGKEDYSPELVWYLIS